MKNYIKWLFKIGWDKTKSESKMVYLKNGRCIGAESYIEYTNRKTKEIRRVWIPAAP